MLVGSLAMKNRKGLAPDVFGTFCTTTGLACVTDKNTKGLAPDVFGTSVPPLALLVSLIRTQKGWLLMYLALLYHHWPCLCH